MNQDPMHAANAPAGTGRRAGAGSRLTAVIAAWSFDHRIRVAQKSEKKFLTEAGSALYTSTSLAVALFPDAQALRVRTASVASQMDELDAALKASLEKDRQDYARASQLMRWNVVARGVLDRWILNDRVRFHRREREQLAHELGVLAADGPNTALRDAVPASMRENIAKARAAIEAAQRERAARLAPWNGQPLPRWLVTVAHETWEFLRHVWDQLSRRLFLRVPAIGALIAGWWIVNHYTDNTLERIERSMGLGGRAHLSPQTLSALKFWLPILAAAASAYIASAIAIRVQRKYALPRDASTP